MPRVEPRIATTMITKKQNVIERLIVSQSFYYNLCFISQKAESGLKVYCPNN